MMNDIQKDYVRAKALIEILKEEERLVEVDYMKKAGIVNDDGVTPERVYCIDDDEMFDTANEAVSEILRSSGFSTRYEEAKKSCKLAEDHLIGFALSLVPDHAERTVLERATRENYTVRMRVLERAVNLDVSTIKR